ncbi:hypothetical protein [Azotobacter chroococcum]|uniref:hypothetical protein n=1 Tax=Azotobacter chroococcum TaxID=353 RepID=UPI00103B0616|nr:hypothetical protein [Azotobacter chroococcum]
MPFNLRASSSFAESADSTSMLPGQAPDCAKQQQSRGSSKRPLQIHAPHGEVAAPAKTTA